MNCLLRIYEIFLNNVICIIYGIVYLSKFAGKFIATIGRIIPPTNNRGGNLRTIASKSTKFISGMSGK